MKRRQQRYPSPMDVFRAERFTRSLPGSSGRLRALLVEPAPYAVMMGGLSLQAVWEDLLRTGEVDCGRAFSEFPDGAPLLPAAPLGSYDLIGVSLPYELDWVALPALLRAGGLTPLARARREDGPLVIAGGASVTMNPEPLAALIDAFVIGEAEPIVPAVVGAVVGAQSRSERLRALARLPGLYVPTQPPTTPVRRLVWPGAATHPRTSLVLSPYAAFPDRFLIEVGRGCPMGCRFCLARTIYQPIRYATRESLLAAAQEGLRVTRKIGLLGASLSGYPRLSELVAELVGAGADVSLSSLRADRITPELLSALRRGGQETVTIAPEAGTETLRAAVGKPIPNAALEAAVAAAAEAGLPEVKLYFMTGLPGETPADREAVVELVEGWASRFPTLRFAVTLSPFVPKPWTPLEGEPCPSVREAREIVEGLSAGLRRRTRANVRPGSARLAAVQAALARGDFAVGRALIEAAEQGGGHAALKKALKREGVDLDRPQEAPDEKPWERALGIAETCGEPGAGGEDRR